jgi:PAS domain S-box-containing protein
MLDSTIIQDAPIGVICVDKNDDFVQFNKKMESISGLKAIDVIGMNLLRDLPDQTLEGEANFKQTFLDAKTSLKKSRCENMPMITPVGNLSYQTTSFVPQLDNDGSYDGMIIYVEEVSDYFQREEYLLDELYHARELSSLYSKDVPVVAFRWSGEKGWPVELVSDNISQYGYRKEDFLSDRILFADIIHPDDLERVIKCTNDQKAANNKYLFNEYRILDSSNNAIWVNEISVFESKKDGGPAHYNGILIDINDRKIAEMELQESKARIESILETTPVGMGIMDNRFFQDVNDKFCTMLGYSKEELLGKSTRMVYPSDEVCKYVGREKYSRFMGGHGIGELETQMLCKNGNVIDVILRYGPIHSAPLYKGVTFTVLDVTDMKNAQRELKRNTAELVQLNQIKDLFSDIIRHDLLSPAGIIKGYTEHMISTEKDEDKLHFLNTIKQNNERMIELIENATRYEKINCIDEIKYSRLDIVQIFKNVVADLDHAIEKRGISVNIISPVECCSIVNPIVSEVFVNLLSNAIKYSPENETVDIDFEDAGSNWKVTVTDRGDGISDEDKKYIFERFKRVDKKGVKGSGLGLAIVKRIMDLHNGDYGVIDNPEGRGSVFWLTLKKSSDEPY